MSAGSPPSLRERVLEVERRVQDLTNPFAVLAQSTFNDVFDHPAHHMDDACDLLSDPDLSRAQKLIVVLSMQRLGREDYLRFLECGHVAYRQRALDRQTFVRVVVPGYDWNTLLVEEWQEHDVREFLNKLLDIPDLREWAIETMAGESARDLAQSREAGQVIDVRVRRTSMTER